ncbi:cob(I)yrinic acid a,c-diamide adenosyltransferase [Ferrimonas lipolytica]|uniref:Corrinoid adenosyltransferase n=1 Tax=Ferrimonas lipolytica TaxID=2724191 RepID=A0A6H1UD42_9GAMM|nr:cob(I)yrinic acid a,c-diamide adenosyltransferase [Ferrimonas lipolytica]QIZ76273.1 cob(I)yrinic acid a,c-diamide adenosyltransferase [Ferrimonas lipolytica]
MKNSEARRLKQKANVEAAVASATIEKGILLIITGNGKGKTTAGFGTAVRALGHDQKVAVVQFVKGNGECGERNLLTKLDVPFHTMNTGFSWNSEDIEQDKAKAREAWQQAQQWLADPTIDLLLLDELTYMVTWGFLELDSILTALRERPSEMSVVITGRAAHRELKALADTVSEVRSEKHAFESKIAARKGVDF